MQTLGVPGLTVTAFDGGRIITQLRSSTQAIELSDSTRIAYAGGNLGDTLYVKASSGTADEIELLERGRDAAFCDELVARRPFSALSHRERAENRL